MDDGRKVRKHLDQLLAQARSQAAEDSAEPMSQDESDVMEYSSKRPISGEPEEYCEPYESTSPSSESTCTADPPMLLVIQFTFNLGKMECIVILHLWFVYFL